MGGDVRDLLKARLVGFTPLSHDVGEFTFEAVETPFSDCAAGAHIDVHLPNGLVRNYSLTGWSPDGCTLSIGVKREAHGRGGSVAMHELDVGRVVQVSPPRNNFPLRTESEPVVLIGGGIGITPLHAMARTLQETGRQFDLHYLVRTRADAAYNGSLRSLGLGETYHLHCEDREGRADFRALLQSYPPETHYFVCGPEAMLASVQEASHALDRGTVSFERFSASPSVSAGTSRSFHIALSSTGEELEVPATKSVLEVLCDAGHDVEYACSEGACGTCITDVLEGEIDHRDSILTDEERSAGDCMCICVSRARSARLVLDI